MTLKELREQLEELAKGLPGNSPIVIYADGRAYTAKEVKQAPANYWNREESKWDTVEAVAIGDGVED